MTHSFTFTRAGRLARAFWLRACAFEGIDSRAKFVQFAPDNPHAALLNRAAAVYARLLMARRIRPRLP